MVYFRENMNVWDIRFGYGKVDVANDREVLVEFAGRKVRYNSDGRFSSNENVSLLQVEPIIQRNIPIVSFEQGELVWCWIESDYSDNGLWGARFFSHIENGEYKCFEYQAKQGNTTITPIIRKFADNPLI